MHNRGMMQLPLNDESLRKASEIIRRGGLVAAPTETFYALLVRFDSEKALDRLYQLKGRNPHKPVGLLAADREMACSLASSVTEAESALMEKHWPGPLTIVLRARASLPSRTVKHHTVAVRVPGYPPLRDLIARVGVPLTATSANPAGALPPVTAERVCEYFCNQTLDAQGLDAIIDGGPTTGGLPSTLVRMEADATPRILRQGAALIDPAPLRELILQMKDAYESVSEFIEANTSRVCPQCESVCCIDRHGTPDEVDELYFRVLQDLFPFETKPPWRVDWDPCRYLGQTGCTLQRWQRPFRCTWYFCPPLLQCMPQDNPRAYRTFIERLNTLQRLRDRLSRIFSGKED